MIEVDLNFMQEVANTPTVSNFSSLDPTYCTKVAFSEIFPSELWRLTFISEYVSVFYVWVSSYIYHLEVIMHEAQSIVGKVLSS